MHDDKDYTQIFAALENTPSESLESDTVEFKGYRDLKALYNSKDLATELVALANHKGGVVIVGVKDSSDVSDNNWPSQLVGFEPVDCVELTKRISGKLSPNLNLSAKNFDAQRKNFLIISIKQSRSTIAMTTDGKCYMRSGRDSMPMTPDQVNETVKRLKGYDWSAEIIDVPNSEELIDPELLEHAIDEYGALNGVGRIKTSNEHFLEEIGVTCDGALTKGGLLFLGNDKAIVSHLGVVEYRFSCRIPGGSLPINNVWQGSIWKSIIMFRKYLDQITKYNTFEFNGKKYKYPNICNVAYEEAMVNSLVHRDYTLDGLSSVDVTQDFIEFTNPGNLFGDISPGSIFKHPPRQRNKSLASILMKLQVLDRAGMGMKRINIECMRLGRSAAQIEAHDGYIKNTIEIDNIIEDIAVLTTPYKDEYDVIELFLINALYGDSYESIEVLISKISPFSENPWRDIEKSVSKIDCLHFVANEGAVYVTVDQKFKEIMKANLSVKPSKKTSELIAIYSYLKKFGSAPSEKLQKLISFKKLKNAEIFLNKINFIQKNESNQWVLS